MSAGGQLPSHVSFNVNLDPIGALDEVHLVVCLRRRFLIDEL